jgi:hypothetical protein
MSIKFWVYETLGFNSSNVHGITNIKTTFDQHGKQQGIDTVSSCNV